MYTGIFKYVNKRVRRARGKILIKEHVARDYKAIRADKTSMQNTENFHQNP